MDTKKIAKYGINKKALADLILQRLIEGLNKEFGKDYGFDEAHKKAAGVYVIIAEAIVDHIMEYATIRTRQAEYIDENGKLQPYKGVVNPETGEFESVSITRIV